MAEPNNISREEVAHMAALSRLRVSDEEQKLFARQFGDILGYMDVLAQVNTENVDPLYSPVQHAAEGREDRAVNRRSREEVLANARKRTESTSSFHGSYRINFADLDLCFEFHKASILNDDFDIENISTRADFSRKIRTAKLSQGEFTLPLSDNFKRKML